MCLCVGVGVGVDVFVCVCVIDRNRKFKVNTKTKIINTKILNFTFFNLIARVKLGYMLGIGNSL